MLDLRFVEKNGGEKSVQEIEKFPCTVGRARIGPVPPPYHYSSLISNGSLSNFHCSIEFDILKHTWDIVDGAGETPSSNGIHYSARADIDMVRVDRATLQFEGERIFFLRTTDGREAYAEVYDPEKSGIPIDRETQGIDPTLLKLKEIELKIQESDQRVEEGAQRGRERDDRIKLLESAAESAGGILIKLDTNKIQMVRGSFIGLIITLILLPIGVIGAVVVNPDKALETMYAIKHLFHPQKSE